MLPTALHDVTTATDVAAVARHADPIVITTRFAPNIPAGTWPAASLPVPFVLAVPRSRDVGAEAAAELQVALTTWQRPPCTAWRARFDGERAAVAADDGVNVVIFHDDMWPAELVPGAVAQTVVTTDGSGFYRDADIHINGKDFRFSLDGAPGTLDLRSILTHELGHALGLGHSSDARATMFATGSGLRWRSLEKDDRDGVCSLYPGVGAAGCDVVPCPAPYTCVADACQRPRATGGGRDVCAPCERVADACEAAGDEARCIDIGAGAIAGRVCARACSADAECGTGFRCIATTASGDRQCVSQVACRNGPSPCQTDAECMGSACRDGACVAPPPGGVDGGTGAGDAGPRDGGADGGDSASGTGGGCGCRVVATNDDRDAAARWLMTTLAVVAFVAALRLRRARGRAQR